MTHLRFLRDFTAGRYLDLMLVAAVTTVVLIRFFLALTGYPQLGPGGLHIAHVLWGGALMLAALVVAISFIGRRPHLLVAILGGAGFGTFIDEVGKFVTQDNDYFYQPAVSLIYVALVLLYLAIRSLHRQRTARRGEYIANAMQDVLEIAVGDLDQRERTRALHYLQRVRGESVVVGRLERILQDAELVPARQPGSLARFGSRLVESYQRMTRTIWFGRVLIAFFVLQLLFKLGRLTALAHLLPPDHQRWLALPIASSLPIEVAQYDLAHWMQLIFSLLSGVFVAWGVMLVFRDRLRALRMFQRSILVALFLTQVFIFYRVEWLGLGELLFNLLVLWALRSMIAHERAMRGGMES
ncbi:MAG: hypothetical protein GF330_06175 [Candidatus Eisenbacteria bacterium]|nr:hypothetical protein [Candidatus Eisenbacteria bacterium]